MKISCAAVHWFRVRRSGLVEPFASPQETARRLLGVQAQLPAAATLALFNRTRRCTVSGIEAARLERRTLVRFWGQRNTVHLHATADWPLLHAAFQDLHSVLQSRLEKAGLAAEFRRLQRRMALRLEKGEQLTHQRVWAPSAQVEAVLLVRGRIVGTWRYERRGKTLRVRMQPFVTLTAVVRRKLTQEAERLAAFLGFGQAEMDWS